MKDKADDDLADGVLTVRQAMQFTTLTRTELYNRMADGQLAFLKYGRKRLIPKRALVALLKSGYVPAVTDGDLLKPKGRAG